MAGVIELSYLVAAVLFIIGLKRLSSPDTARGGNMMSAVGMLIAIVATLLDREIIGFQLVVIGMVAGAAVAIALISGTLLWGPWVTLGLAVIWWRLMTRFA